MTQYGTIWLQLGYSDSFFAVTECVTLSGEVCSMGVFHVSLRRGRDRRAQQWNSKLTGFIATLKTIQEFQVVQEYRVCSWLSEENNNNTIYQTQLTQAQINCGTGFGQEVHLFPPTRHTRVRFHLHSYCRWRPGLPCSSVWLHAGVEASAAAVSSTQVKKVE